MKRGRGFSVVSSLQKVDMFGQGVAFSIAGSSSVTSCAGALMTILIAVTTMAYAYTRFEVMIDYADTRF